MANHDDWNATVHQISFVIHRRTDSNWSLRDLVNSQHCILAYALSGCAHYRCSKGAFTINKGGMLFFPPGMAHSANSDQQKPWAYISTAFALEHDSQQNIQLMQKLPVHTVMENDVETGLLFSELDHLWISRESGYLLRCRSIILQLLYSLVRAYSQPDQNVPHARRIAEIVDFLQRNYTKSYSLDELSEKAGLSPSRFRTLFKQMTGYSVVRYQNWLRMNKARDLLLSGEYSVTRAAQLVGLDDVYYFSRLFTKMTGRNPSEFRNR